MISIYASELAACIGMNKYRPVQDVAKKVWSRVDPISYKKALERNEIHEPVPIQDVLQELKLTERVTGVIGQNNSIAMQTTLRSFLLDHMDEFDSKDVTVEDVTSFVFTERGKNSEEDSLDRVQTRSKIVVRERNAKFYKRYIEYNEGESKFMLGGKVDGITEDGCLVEVKNRQYKFFPSIPVYENVQIHAYMFLTDIKSCKFVQSFNGEDREEMVTFDEEFWKKTIDKCTEFVVSLDKLLLDDAIQDQLLSLGVF